MFKLPPPQILLQHAFGDARSTRRDQTTQTDAPDTGDAAFRTGATIGGIPRRPAGDAGGAFLPRDFGARDGGTPAVPPDAVARAERQTLQSMQRRRRVDTIFESLVAGEGVAPYRPGMADPADGRHCFRYRARVLEVRPLQAFVAGADTGFELHLHGNGLMARRDGAWIEEPGDAFFSALDAAAHGWQPAP